MEGGDDHGPSPHSRNAGLGHRQVEPTGVQRRIPQQGWRGDALQNGATTSVFAAGKLKLQHVV